MEKLPTGLTSDSSPFLVYEEVDAEIEIVNLDADEYIDNSETVDAELQDVVFEQQETTDPNENPKYSKKVKNKLAVLKCEKNAYIDMTKQFNEDLIQEAQKVQQKYQDYNKKISEGCFSQYNPYSLREFAKTFTKFRKGKKCTQGDVRRDLENFMKKPLTTLMISKFENLNLSGTKMVGIKMLLKFWMKIKNLEENRKSALSANQKSMLKGLRRENVFNTLDHSIMDDQSMVNMEPSKDLVLTMENEPAIARFKFDDGLLTRMFDCAEVSEKVDIDSGVKEKLDNLKHKERMKKEEEKKENVQMRKERKSLLEEEIGENVVKKKRGRPVSSHKWLKGGKRAKLEKLTNVDQNKVVKRGKPQEHAKVKESKNKKKSLFKPKKVNSKENKTPKMEKKQSRRRTRCGTCEACSRKDCGACRNCLNMLKFGGSGSTRQACKTRICLAKTSSGRKNVNNGSNNWEKNDSQIKTEAPVVADCNASKSFEEEMSENITRVPMMPETSSGFGLVEDNVNAEALSHELPAILDHEKEVSQNSDPVPMMTESSNVGASEETSRHFNITYTSSPSFLTYMQMLMATEENKADEKKMMEDEVQLTNSEHTHADNLSSIGEQSAVHSQNRQPSVEMSINQSPDAGGDIALAASVTDIIESNTGGHILSPNTGGEIQEPNLQRARDGNI